MLLITLDRSSDLLAVLRRTGHFGLDVLGTDHAVRARTFARKGGAAKFIDVTWDRVGGAPGLPGLRSFITCSVARSLDSGDHVVVMGNVTAAGRSPEGVLVRVHSECLTGDILGSLSCDCGRQLEQALQAVAAEGCDVVVYLRGREGRGIGLGHRIHAYALQEQGLDSLDANTAPILPVDACSYSLGAQVLADLGVHRIRLISNHLAQYDGLEDHGISVVDRVVLPAVGTPHIARYLRTRRDRWGQALTAGSAAGIEAAPLLAKTRCQRSHCEENRDQLIPCEDAFPTTSPSGAPSKRGTWKTRQSRGK